MRSVRSGSPCRVVASSAGDLAAAFGYDNSMERSIGFPAIILLVDDDDGLRGFVRRVLRPHGFNIKEASDGVEALKVAAYAERIDLLLTDVIMPNMTGVVLAERLLLERPGVPVLYMSGYVEKSMVLAKHPEFIFLQKPFTPDGLIVAVRQLLASKEE